MVEPVSLPWKRPRKGLVVAEAGASFRVEREDGEWTCTVVRGGKRQVLAKGLARQREGLCRAEVAAASMPEVQAALSEQTEAQAATPEAAKGTGRRGKQRGPKGLTKAGRKPRDEAPNRRRDPAPLKQPQPSKPLKGGASSKRALRVEGVSFEPVEDGCICGKVGEVTWVADPAGQVVFTGEVEAGEAARVRSAANEHFAAARPVVQEQDKPKAKRGPKRREGHGPKRHNTNTNTEKKRGNKRASPSEPSGPKPTRKSKSKRSGDPKPGRKGAREKGEPKRERKVRAAHDARETTLHWVDVDGQLRASTPLGSFAIVREGESEELYFYDLNGTSRHIRGTGDRKQMAAEMAARGEAGPSVQTPSPELQAQMMMAFLRVAEEEAA